MNKVMLTGRLVRDTEKTQYETKDGLKYVLKGVMAVDRGYTARSDGKKADFFNFETWVKNESTLPQYLLKGVQILVEGNLKQDSVKNDDGSYKNYPATVINSKIEILNRKGEVAEQEAAPHKTYKTVVSKPEDNKDVPWELDL